MTTNMLSNPLLNTNTNTNNMKSEFFGDGEFEFASDFSRPYFQSAHKAITRCELWNWLQKYEPEEDKGFMFTRDVPELDRLNKEMQKDPVNGGHSGSSYAITMRNMEFIAKNGYEEFKNNCIKSYS